LAKHKEFYETVCPGCGGAAVRETDVSDTFLDSSWYFLRYPSVNRDGKSSGQVGDNFSLPQGPHKGDTGSSKLANLPLKDAAQLPWDPKITKKWLPVDMYTGGAEHSVLHLLYSRFVTMALKDWGYLSFEEPFTRFYAHGLVIKGGAKMSKSKGNVVNPDEYIKLYGTDALRMYLMFMGPFDQGGDFRDSAMEGLSRWVGRIWRMAEASLAKRSIESSATITSALQKAIKRVGDDIEKRRYNTAIAGMMEFTNLVSDEGGKLGVEDLKKFILILAPFAPHITEELWSQVSPIRSVGPKIFSSVHTEPWPKADETKILKEDVTIAVQVAGRLRDTITVNRELSLIQSDIETEAKKRENVQKFLAGKTVRKVIFVPGKLINFVL
jgi:leucyl-tRNA synthetase